MFCLQLYTPASGQHHWILSPRSDTWARSPNKYTIKIEWVRVPNNKYCDKSCSTIHIFSPFSFAEPCQCTLYTSHMGWKGIWWGHQRIPHHLPTLTLHSPSPHRIFLSLPQPRNQAHPPHHQYLQWILSYYKHTMPSHLQLFLYHDPMPNFWHQMHSWVWTKALELPHEKFKTPIPNVEYLWDHRRINVFHNRVRIRLR